MKKVFGVWIFFYWLFFVSRDLKKRASFGTFRSFPVPKQIPKRWIIHDHSIFLPLGLQGAFSDLAEPCLAQALRGENLELKQDVGVVEGNSYGKWCLVLVCGIRRTGTFRG
jgi:hypothetical protein